MNAEQVIEDLLAQCRLDHASWLNSDASGYEFALPGSSIMGAFGAASTDVAAMTTGQRRGVQQFTAGEGTVELVTGGVEGEIAWLVMIERAEVLFASRSERSRWDLRVTELFRLTDGAWRRFHRHADPLVDFHSLDEILPLLH